MSQEKVRRLALTVLKFKKRFGLSQAELNNFAKRGVVEIVQSGYAGHSLMHPRLVIYYRDEVERALEPTGKDSEWKYRCLGYLYRKSAICSLGFRTKKDLLAHQRATYHSGWEPYKA